jgi:hypothetical protein
LIIGLHVGKRLNNLAVALQSVASHHEYERLSDGAKEVSQFIKDNKECFDDDSYELLRHELAYAIRSSAERDFLSTSDSGMRLGKIMESPHDTEYYFEDWESEKKLMRLNRPAMRRWEKKRRK